MSIFNQKSKFKVKADIRAVRQAVEPAGRPKPKQQQQLSAAGASGSRGRASPSGGGGGSGSGSTPRASPRPGSIAAARQRHRLQSASPLPPSGDEGGNSRKRHAVSSRSPASPNFSESGDDEEEDDWEESLDARKRSKRVHQSRADPNRSFAHPKLWAGGDENTERLPILHANDVASLEQKCQPALGLAQEDVVIKLQYPGARYPERYELVWGKDKIEAVKDIVKVVNFVASIYLNDEDAKPFLDQSTGICRRLEKSRNTKDGAGFKVAVKEYNERLMGLQRKGVIAKNLGDLSGILRELIAFILDQIYDRTVAPNVELLSKYENGTDNVYGELLHPFISDILERAGLTSDKVFVDLGSGVGNVVLQAALETGAESWGCEMMENACNLADAQKQEFLVRCRLWGLDHGSVHLERGDFRKSEKTLAALKRADVVLVNNQAFTAQLNDNLVNMFLDLKPGCKIISLKTFVHDNKNAENDVATSILDVEHLTYPEEYVSWTNASGTFCISTRKG